MTQGDEAACRSRIAYRLVALLLPPHRKDWADAMLNESHYIRSRRAALQWALGCACAAFRVRVTYELGRTFMTRRILKVPLYLAVVLAIGAIGIYIDAKPYQRDRMWRAVYQVVVSDNAQRTDRGKNAFAR
jgi:hypothetical protein